MRRFTQVFTALAVLATSGVAIAPAPAEAQSYRDYREFRGDRGRAERRDFRRQQRFVESFCARNPGARDCREFRRDARRWDDRRYQRWYRDNYRQDRRDAATAAIFGLAAGVAAGAIAGGANRGPSGGYVVDSGSVQRCAARYRTYDPRTNTYVANSRGERRVCQL